MTVEERVKYIKNWILKYIKSMPKKPSCLVVGVSGGIDSAVVSTIAALTGLNVKALSMPIHQLKFQDDLSKAHIQWLKKNFKNVDGLIINLDETFNAFSKTLNNFNSEHAFANSRARMRMLTLYQVAGSNNGIVVGTGNKVEDFGVGFYTKYGDGGVDISPIADCLKTEVWEMGKYLNILDEIITAQPTDGLWRDGRTDEKQLGMTYLELEKAMNDPKDKNHAKYLEIREKNLHKINPIPVCTFDNN
ncbi:MAG: NAD(+) synthase [Pelagibacterales bacterium]|nr:NAD(+) synthase [Pelagibacterales bacterium]